MFDRLSFEKHRSIDKITFLPLFFWFSFSAQFVQMKMYGLNQSKFPTSLKRKKNTNPKDCVGAESRRLQRSPPREEPEVIDAWGLMEGLEEGMLISNQAKKTPKPRAPVSSTWLEAWRAQTSSSANGAPLAGPP
jgi:hypothetical protein